MLCKRPQGLDQVKSISGILSGFGLCVVVLGVLFTMACLSSAATRPMPNLAMPTLGGVQFWRDEKIAGGWRLQCHVWTHHCRLLDRNNVRRAWGSFAGCDNAMWPIRTPPSQRGMVLLVHGIARGPGTFGNLPQRLREQGFDAVAISYPSTRGSLESHANQIKRIIRRMPYGRKVSFVTHSMGALVVREMNTGNQHWRQGMHVGRIVMIAPPNQGSAVAEFLKDNLLYRLLYGKAGQALVPSHVTKLAVPDVPFAIIAGGKGDGKGYNPWLPGDDDGTVSVEESQWAGAADSLVLPGLHGFIAKSDAVVPPVVAFLATGRFGDDDE